MLCHPCQCGSDRLHATTILTNRDATVTFDELCERFIFMHIGPPRIGQLYLHKPDPSRENFEVVRADRNFSEFRREYEQIMAVRAVPPKWQRPITRNYEPA